MSTMKALSSVLLMVLSMTSFIAVGQPGQIRGEIIKPATTQVMDPDHDGFVSIQPTGFSNKGFDAYYVKEFEIPMFGIPISGSGEALGDNQVGASCGITDITVDSLGFGAYAVLDNAQNLIFRFRIGTNKPSVESYSILIDTDGKMGTDDPNSTPNNPGFEIDITLIKNSNKGVYVYNIDGIESCPTPLRNYSYDSNFQISIADIITCSNPDYFYDYFVPFADLQSLFGITTSTELRFVALTNISGTCAMAGKISDVGGVDDTLYGGCNTCAFLDLGSSQCPTSLNDLCSNCTGFQSGVTPKPTIDSPVKAGENIISGTAVVSANIFVDLLSSTGVLKESAATATASSGCTVCPWTVTFVTALTAGDIVSAKAKSTTGCQSGGVSSDATVTIVVNNVPPIITGALSGLIYSENDPPLLVEPNMLLTDTDNVDLDHATVSISGNFIPGEDILSFSTATVISGSFNPATGMIAFTGVAPLTSYRTLLRSISYSNTSENPSILTRTIRFSVHDGLNISNTYDRLIDVARINDPPVANNDPGIANEDTPVTIPNISINDTDIDGTVDASTIDLDPLTAGKQITFTSVQGVWSVDATGAVLFGPQLNFNGVATKTYTVNDNLGATSGAATISITVSPVNDLPVANNDAGTTNENTPVTLPNITADDTDVDGTVDPSTVDLDLATAGQQTSITDAQGNWVVDAGGNIIYTPALSFAGLAILSYRVKDNSGADSNIATITITVNPLSGNAAPVAVNDTETTNEDTAITLFGIAGNDTDADGTINVATLDLDPADPGRQTTLTNAQGTWIVNLAGDVTYDPALNFNGTATKTYVVKDNSGATSNVATLSIIVNPVNDAPVATNDSGVTNEDTAITLPPITSNDTDVDGTVVPGTIDLDPLTPGQQTSFTNTMGIWNVSPPGDLTFQPTLHANGITSLQYTANDNLGLVSNLSTVTISVNAVNDAPILNDLTVTTNRNIPVSSNVFDISDVDPDGTLLTASTIPLTAPTNGNISINSDGSYTYSPNLNFVGTDLVEVEICDNGVPLPSACLSKVITLIVNPSNNPPIFIINGVPGSVLGTATPEDTPVVFCFETADLDGDQVAISSVINLSGGGKLEPFGNAQYCYQFLPTLDFYGVSIWKIDVCDNGNPNLCGSLTVTILVTPVNDPPVAVRDSTRVLRQVSSSGNLMLNDYDVENDVILTTTSPLLNTQHGQVILMPDGAFNYISDLTYRGLDSLVYQICDSGLPSGCSNGTLIILVEDLPLKVYEGFSPNGDGVNDYLRIDGLDYYTNSEVSIFDRYNNLVFQMKGYNNEDKVWRGQANKGPGSNELPEETYFYFISLGDGSPPMKGFVILKRN